MKNSTPKNNRRPLFRIALASLLVLGLALLTSLTGAPSPGDQMDLAAVAQQQMDGLVLIENLIG